MNRRNLLAALGGIAAVPGLTAPARAQHVLHGLPPDLMSPLKGPGPVVLSPQQLAQRAVDSPAPAGPPGSWKACAPLPLPRSEMAWATAWEGRMHVVGGYAEQRVDRPYHHVYDPAADRWTPAAPLPLGANHVGVVADGGRLYAIGGFVEQNRAAHGRCFAYEFGADRWTEIAPLSRPRGAASVVALGGRIHAIGGAGDPAAERASVGWHEVYDPKRDRWDGLKPLPGARDHAGTVAHRGVIHVIGGRFNTFEYNTPAHHVYGPERDTWTERRPMPTVRSGHGLVVLNGRFWAMGGESGRFENGTLTGTVHGQLESYDPKTDTWQHHAPMPTPRHGLGAVTLGERIHVAGGGPVVGGAIQTSTHEAFLPG